MFKKSIISLGVLVILTIGFWSIGIPDKWLSKKIESLLHIPSAFGIDDKSIDVSASLKGFRKTPLFGFSANEMTIVRGSHDDFLKVHDITGRIDPFSLIRLTVNLSFEGTLSGGRIKGNVQLGRKGIDLDIDLSSVNIEAIDIVKKTSSLKGTGKLNLKGVFTMKNTRKQSDIHGHILFDINDLNFRDLSMETYYVPMSYFNQMKGALRVSGQTLKIEAISMEGNKIYSRMKGTITGTVLRGTLEIMPDPDFPETLLMVIQRFRHSPGYYVIPLKGPIATLL
jgi:type II secretion system protein N